MLAILGMGVVLLAVAGASMLMGTVDITPAQVLALVAGDGEAPEQARLILMEIRLPRILLAVLVGYALALGGVVFQAVLRNPLADPFILGVSSGSACGAVLGIALGFGFGVPALSFAGALLSVFLLLAIGSKTIGTESSTILLTGVIINAFFTATVMFFLSIAADEKLHTMLFWLYGDLSQPSYRQLALIAPVLLPVSLVLYGLSRHLDLLTMGEDTAMRLGMDVVRTKLTLLILVSLTVSVVVAFSGIIGFVGLIVPHLVRMACGSDHRLLIPLAALGGAAFLIAADTLARTLLAPTELPVGVISAFLGAPFFIFLLRTRGTRWNRF